MTWFHYIVLALFAIFAIVDFLFHARIFRRAQLWRVTGIVATLMLVSVTSHAQPIA